MSCGNTHTPDTVSQASQTARQPAHPQLPPVQARSQPAHLQHGKERHEAWRAEQTAWAESVGHEAEAKEVTVEKASSGKPGRIDQVTWIDPDHEGAVITDFKTTRFDKYSEAKLASVLKGYFQQLDDYRFSPTLDLAESMSYLQIEHRPTTPGYAEYIENACADAGVTVIFLDD
jgi:hypothetical protein